MKRISTTQQHTDTMLLRIISQHLMRKNITIKYDMSDIDESKFKSSTTSLDIKKRAYITLLASSLCNRIMSYIPDGENAVFVLKKYTKAHVEMKPYYGQLQTSSGEIVDFISAMHYLSSEDVSMQDMIHNILKSHPTFTESANSKINVDEKLSCLFTQMSSKEYQDYIMDMLFVSNDTFFYEITERGMCFYTFKRKWLCSWFNNISHNSLLMSLNDENKKNIIGIDISIKPDTACIHIKRPMRLSTYHNIYSESIKLMRVQKRSAEDANKKNSVPTTDQE